MPKTVGNGPRRMHWRQWFERCAIERCNPETAAVLAAFARVRVTSMLKKYGCLELIPEYAPRSRDIDEGDRLKLLRPWLLLEEYLVAGRGGDGKKYKKWLREKNAGGDYSQAQTWAANATTCIRTVVRQTIVQNEGAGLRSSAGLQQATLESVNASLGPDDARSLLDKLESEPKDTQPFSSVYQTEVDRIARQVADSVFPELEDWERIIIVATLWRISLANPKVVELAGRGKSQLYAGLDKVRNKVLRGVTRTLESHGGETGQNLLDAEAPEVLQDIAERCTKILAERCVLWARSSENGGEDLFMLMDTDSSMSMK